MSGVSKRKWIDGLIHDSPKNRFVPAVKTVDRRPFWKKKEKKVSVEHLFARHVIPPSYATSPPLGDGAHYDGLDQVTGNTWLLQLGDASAAGAKRPRVFHGPSGHRRPWILGGLITINYFFCPAYHLNWYSGRPF
jgi:hypothetical protein